jgi:Kef-type K+ transport system membrane component KefB
VNASPWSFLPAWPPDFGQLLAVAALLIVALLAGEAVRIWLRATRIVGYVVAGAVLGPGVLGIVDAATVHAFRPIVDIAVGLLLFELGQRVDLGWLRRNRWLLATSVLEAALSFAAVYAVLAVVGVRPVVAAAIAVFAVATSPAVVMAVVEDLRGQGQVTERTLLFTALNTAYSVIGLTILAGWLHLQRADESAMTLVHPIYVAAGSVAIAALMAAIALGLLTLFGRRPGFQFTLVVAVVLFTVAVAAGMRISLPLTLLLAGVFMRSFDRRRSFVSLRFGEPATLFIVILFAVAGASLQLSGWRDALIPALGFIAARFVGKGLPLLLLARPSALSVRQASLVNLALVPMSGLALLLLGELTASFPEIAGEVTAPVLLATTILTLLGPLATEFALRRADEAGATE